MLNITGISLTLLELELLLLALITAVSADTACRGTATALAAGCQWHSRNSGHCSEKLAVSVCNHCSCILHSNPGVSRYELLFRARTYTRRAKDSDLRPDVRASPEPAVRAGRRHR